MARPEQREKVWVERREGAHDVACGPRVGRRMGGAWVSEGTHHSPISFKVRTQCGIVHLMS